MHYFHFLQQSFELFFLRFISTARDPQSVLGAAAAAAALAGSFTVSTCTKRNLKCPSAERWRIEMLSYECDSIPAVISLTLFSFRSGCVGWHQAAKSEIKSDLTFRRWPCKFSCRSLSFSCSPSPFVDNCNQISCLFFFVGLN